MPVCLLSYTIRDDVQHEFLHLDRELVTKGAERFQVIMRVLGKYGHFTILHIPMVQLVVCSATVQLLQNIWCKKPHNISKC